MADEDKQQYHQDPGYQAKRSGQDDPQHCETRNTCEINILRTHENHNNNKL